MDQVLDVLGEDGDLKQQESIKNIEALGGGLLVVVVQALLKDVDHVRDKLGKHGNLILLILLDKVANLTQGLNGCDTNDLGLRVNDGAAEEFEKLAQVVREGISHLEDGIDDINSDLAVTSGGTGRALEQEGDQLGPGAGGNLDSSHGGNDTGSCMARQ